MERDDEAGKGVCYPMLMTCCAGIEFLGALRSVSPFQTQGAGSRYFAEFWQSCLYPNPSPHNGFGEVVYQLIRHGIAHSFFTKGSIGVVRKQPHLHFTRDANGLLLVDAVQMGRDVIASYLTHIKPVLTDPARIAIRAAMETRLNEMERSYGAEASKHPASFPATGISSLEGQTGPTGPATQSVVPAPSITGPVGPLRSN